MMRWWYIANGYFSIVGIAAIFISISLGHWAWESEWSPQVHAAVHPIGLFVAIDRFLSEARRIGW